MQRGFLRVQLDRWSQSCCAALPVGESCYVLRSILKNAMKYLDGIRFQLEVTRRRGDTRLQLGGRAEDVVQANAQCRQRRRRSMETRSKSTMRSCVEVPVTRRENPELLLLVLHD